MALLQEYDGTDYLMTKTFIAYTVSPYSKSVCVGVEFYLQNYLIVKLTTRKKR